MPFYIITSDHKILGKLIRGTGQPPLKLKKGLFLTNKINEDIFCTTEDTSVKVLKTSRNIEKVEIDYEKEIFNLGSLILLAYEPLSDVSANRAIYRLISKTPCFKASSLIYLFPSINYSKYMNRGIVSPSMIIKKIIIFGGKVISASRLTLVYPRDCRIILEELKQSLNGRMMKMNKKLQQLKNTNNTRKIKTLSEIRSEIKTLRGLITVYEKELNMDLVSMKSKLINNAKIAKELMDEIKHEGEI